MSFRPPRLDDRSYEDLVAELLARIPAHTPEWTNPRPGDPGRTLIELFSWLGDALLYRANLIPERHRLAFLRLLGIPLRPARPSRGLTTVSLKENEPVAAYRIKPLARLNGPVSFEVRNEFTVLPVTAGVYYKRKTKTDEVRPEIEQALSEFHAGGGAISSYRTTPLFAAGQPLNEGFDIVPGTSDRCLWFALFSTRSRPPDEQPQRNSEVVQSIGRQKINIGFDPALPTTDPLEPATARSQIPHVWEITANTTGKTIDELNPWKPEYLALDEVADTTAGLTRPGIIRLSLPEGSKIHAPTNDVRSDPDAGIGDRPPRLDDTDLASRLVAWIRLRPGTPQSSSSDKENWSGTGSSTPQSGMPTIGAAPVPQEVEHLRIIWAGVNAVEIEQLVTHSNLIIGESNGTPDQEFQLPAASVEPETLILEVEEAGRWDRWIQVEDLATLDPTVDTRIGLDGARDARVYRLDAFTGMVLFGDGIRGRIPSAGRRIRVKHLRSGGGSAGNIPSGTLKTITATSTTDESIGSRLIVVQPMALSGGFDPETLREAEVRIPARLRHRDRAVAAEDYRMLAWETPGISVGRVELLPRFKPQQRQSEIPGIVTVMALPQQQLGLPPNPRADRPFLEAIHAWLDKRRPLATELYVIGCEYVPVAVSVAVTVSEGVPLETTLQAVKNALRHALWPLDAGGRKGWPLGRILSNRELAVEAARVSGISEVAGLNLFKRNLSSGDWVPLGDSRNGQEQNLELERWQLPELLAIVAVAEVEGETAGVGGVAGAPLSITEGTVNPFAEDNAVPLSVPTVPDTC